MPRSLARISSAQLQAELRRRERATGTLLRRRGKLQAQVDALDAQIAQLGGSVNGEARRGPGRRTRGGTGRRRRAKNGMTLTEALAKALGRRSMSVTEAAAAVRKAGYRTNSKSFRTQVNIALIKSGKFKRVGRGEYAVK